MVVNLRLLWFHYWGLQLFFYVCLYLTQKITTFGGAKLVKNKTGNALLVKLNTKSPATACYL